jgi:hypothetical protein
MGVVDGLELDHRFCGRIECKCNYLRFSNARSQAGYIHVLSAELKMALCYHCFLVIFFYIDTCDI